MNNKRLAIIGIGFALTAGFVALQNMPASPPDRILIPATTKAVGIDIPTPTSTYAGCAFIWANHDDPELTEKVDAAVRALYPSAGAHANLYGEDCVYADGHATFSTMETDFYIQAPVEDLTDQQALGNWMKPVLDAILEIAGEAIQGNDGFVDFRFTKSETESLIVHVPMQQYRSEAQGMTGKDLFQLFHKNN